MHPTRPFPPPARPRQGGRGRHVGRLAAGLLVAFSLAAGLSGCGGGSVSVGVGVGCCWGDEEPWATISADVSAAYPGDGVQLSARVGDDRGVEHVRLYQTDWRGTFELDRVDSGPLRWVVTVPDDPGGSVGWYVVAIDGDGLRGTSRLAVVDILR